MNSSQETRCFRDPAAIFYYHRSVSGKRKTCNNTSPSHVSKRPCNGEKIAGTNEFAFFRCRSICTGGGGVQNQAETKKFQECLPAGTGTKIYFSSVLLPP